MKGRRILARFGLALLTATLLYVLAAEATFALRHPELTDTERLLRIGDALLWKVMRASS